MRAGDLAQPFPVVTPDTEALAAVRAMAASRFPGLVVCDDGGHPYTVLPGSQVLRFLIPDYPQHDPALARALDERAADERAAGQRAAAPAGGAFGAGAPAGLDPAAIDPASLPKGFEKFLGQ